MFAAAALCVAHPSGAVSEQGGRVHQGRHFAQARLGQLKVGQGLPKHASVLRILGGFVQGPARHAQRRSRHRCAKNIQGAHGQFETTMRVAQLGLRADMAVGEGEGRQGVWRHHMQVGRAVQARVVRIHDEGCDAARTGFWVGFGKHHIKVGDAAVADPGLLALEHMACGAGLGAGQHARHIRPGIGFAQCKGSDLLALCDSRQVLGLLCGRARQRDGTAAQALHGKSEIGQGGMPGQGLAQDHQGARIQLGQGTALRSGHTVAQPTALAQALHPFATGLAVIVFVHRLAWAPSVQALRQRLVLRPKERQLPLGCAHLSPL